MTELQRIARNAGCKITPQGIVPRISMWERFKQIMHLDPAPVELGLSFVLILMGLRCFAPLPIYPGMMHDLSRSYGLPLIGIWLLSLGIIRFRGVLLGLYLVRRVVSFFSLFTWLTFAISSAITQRDSFLPELYVAFACASLWVFFSDIRPNGEDDEDDENSEAL